MTEKAELVAVEKDTLPAVQPSMTLAPLVEAVMSGQLDTDKMRELLAIQKDYEANEAMKAYHKAVAAFKMSPPKVIKDRENTQYSSSYVSKANLMNTVNAAMSPFGLNVHFTIDQTSIPGQIGITAILTHEMGHSEQAIMFAPPDTSGQKNPIQQIKSTKTYLEIATYESVTGIAATDAGDDDGKAACPVDSITDEQALKIESLITDNDLNKKAFMGWLLKSTGSEHIADIPAEHHRRVIRKINTTIAAKTEREPGEEG